LNVNLFPSLASIALTQFERDNKKNCLAVRKLVLDVVNKRKAENALFGQKNDDLLDLLLRDPVFSENESVIVDELLTVFFAGSQTSANTTQNLLFHLSIKPDYKKKIVEEVNSVTHY